MLLYAHWFLTVLAMFETCARAAVHGFIALIFCALFYFIYCLSCGKTKFFSTFTAFGYHNLKMCSLYAGLVCSLIGNIIMPWNPPLYAFKRTIHLTRPPGVNSTYLDFDGYIRGGCCAICCGSCLPEIGLPKERCLKLLLISYGGSTATLSCCYGAGGGCMSYATGLERSRLEMVRENETATIDFYQQTYQVSSFDELIARQLQAGQAVPAAAVYSHPHQQAPAYVTATPVIVTATPVSNNMQGRY